MRYHTEEEHIQSLQIIHDIAMSIRTNFDFDLMLKSALPTFLKKLNCSAGAIYQKETISDIESNLIRIYSIPKNIDKIKEYEIVSNHINRKDPNTNFNEFYKKISENIHFYIFDLPNYGVMTLIKHGKEFSPLIISSLKPLLSKLADACNDCITKKDKYNLEQRVKELDLLLELAEELSFE